MEIFTFCDTLAQQLKLDTSYWREELLVNKLAQLKHQNGFESREDSKLSAVDRLVNQIHGMIAERNLGEGDALPTERELGEQFKAGRNTVREALHVLRAYGMIETRPKVGAVVRDGHGEALRKLFSFHHSISPESYKDLQGFRRIVEVGVGEKIILHASNMELDRLSLVNDKILSSEGASQAALYDYEFHEAIVKLSGNLTTLESYRMLRPVMEEIMHMGKEELLNVKAIHGAHAKIVEALKSRDRTAYNYLMDKHLEYGLRFVV